MTEFRQTHGQDAIVLFCLDSEKKLRIQTAGDPLEPQPGDTVIAVVSASKPDGSNGRPDNQTAEDTEESIRNLL